MMQHQLPPLDNVWHRFHGGVIFPRQHTPADLANISSHLLNPPLPIQTH